MRALVIAGGGAKGAWACGVLQRFGDQSFDMVVGCSSGALNAVGYSHLGINGLLDYWRGIKGRSDVFGINWTLTDGIYNTKPLRKMISQVIKKPARLPVHVNRVCLETGDLVYNVNGEVGYEDAIVASCSMPGIVVPVKVDGMTYVDGGVRENCPMRRPIDLGCDDITVVLCSAANTDYWTPQKGVPSFVNNFTRSLDIMCHEMVMGDLAEVYRKNNDPTKQVVRVTLYAPESDPMGTVDFDPELIREAIQAGRDAEPKVYLGGVR